MNKAKLSCGIEGWFHVIHKDKDGNTKFDGEFKNLIMDQGLDGIATRSISTSANACLLLTDNTVPVISETAQDTDWSFYSTNLSGAGGVGGAGEDHRGFRRHIYDFGPFNSAQNFSSVGIGYYTAPLANRALFSRALILDASNNPTTLSILEGDYVQVTYRYYFYPSLDDVTGTLTLDGDIGGTYNYIVRLCNVDNHQGGTAALTPGFYSSDSFSRREARISASACYTGDIGPVNGFPSGVENTTYTDTTSFSPQAYIPGTFFRRHTYRRGLRSNPINIRSAVHQVGLFAYQTQFDPPIPKTISDILDLTYEVSWGRR